MRLSVRLTLAMTTLVVSAVAAVGVLAYYNVGRAVVPAGIQRLADQTKARIGAVDALLNTVRNEVFATRTFPAHQGIIRARRNGGVDPEVGFSEEKWRHHLAEVYAGQMSAKLGIDRYRFIGVADGGRELVRVDRAGSRSRHPDRSVGGAGTPGRRGVLPSRRRDCPIDEIYLSWARSDPVDGRDDAVARADGDLRHAGSDRDRRAVRTDRARPRYAPDLRANPRRAERRHHGPTSSMPAVPIW